LSVDNLEPPPSNIRVWDWSWIKWLNNLYEWVKANNMKDYALEVSRGNVNGVSAVNKFGRSTNVDTENTDIWDVANSTDDQPIWLAPTAARIHSIVSTSAADAAAGTGALSLTVYGLTDWDTKETSETVTLTGATPVNTVGSYVIIHRMVCNYQASTTSANVGVITATAATDSTITAQINALEGQTQMAIYGFPSIQTFYMNDMYGGVNKQIAGSSNMSLLFNPNPGVQELGFSVKSTFATNSAGETMAERIFRPPNKFSGPGILKVQGYGSVVNLDVSAGFGGYLVDN